MSGRCSTPRLGFASLPLPSVTGRSRWLWPAAQQARHLVGHHDTSRTVRRQRRGQPGHGLVAVSRAKKLAARHLEDDALVLLTSSYGVTCPLAAFSHNGKKGKRQVNC